MGGDQRVIVTLSAETQTNILFGRKLRSCLDTNFYKLKVKNTCSIIYFVFCKIYIIQTDKQIYIIVNTMYY